MVLKSRKLPVNPVGTDELPKPRRQFPQEGCSPRETRTTPSLTLLCDRKDNFRDAVKRVLTSLSAVSGSASNTKLSRLALRLAVLLFAPLIAQTPIRADDLAPLWQLLPGDRPYITTDNSQRGLAFNPATTNLVLVNRAGGLNVIVLDGATGAEVRTLNTDGVAGGTFALNMVGVTDDGVVYAANLSTSTTAPNFKIYRWASDKSDAAPEIAFEGDPAGLDAATGASRNPQRWGDSFDVRGSGANTMIVAASRASTAVAVFTTTDGLTFTAKVITGASAGAGSLGVAFGEGSRLWLKSSGTPLRHVEFNLATGQATLIKEFADPIFPNAAPVIGVAAAKKLLGAFTVATPDQFRLYDISTTADVTLLDQENLPTDNANANGTGAVDFGAVSGANAAFVLDTNNGLVAYRIAATAAAPPTISAEPQNQTVLVGATVSFNVAAKGTLPFAYQWQFSEADLAGATNSILTLTNVSVASSGNYRVKVSNSAGSAASTNAVLTVNRVAQSEVLTPLWKLAPGDRPYINTDGTQRGIAYNPATGNALLVSRTGGNKIYVLDGKTGAELRQLNIDTAVVSGGTFAVNMIGVANDGAVYAANLVTDSSTAAFAIYRWENDSATAVPVLAYRDDPSGGSADAASRRFGDSFDVRGSGANTQLLAGTRNGKNAALFTSTDGITFTSTVINTDATAGDFGLGVAFGAGNSFWGTAINRPLRLIDFDLAAGTGTTRVTLGANDVPLGVSTIGVDAANTLLAAIAVENPDNLRLYHLASLPNPPAMVDQELFPTDNANANATGSVDFGGGRLYVMNSNNGLLAFTVNPGAIAPAQRPALSAPSRQPGGAFQFTLSGTAAASYVIEATQDFRTWLPISTNTVGAAGTAQVTDASAPAQAFRFYRAAPTR